jgi:predicted small integral membrane protein
MLTILPDLPDVISGIITLGANGGEHLFLLKIHSVLFQMKQHNRMLASLWFSITGSVCYSRDIENVLLFRSEKGVLRVRCERGKLLVISVYSIAYMMAVGIGSILI